MAFPRKDQEDDTTIDVHTAAGAPVRYVPLDHVYSATSPCVSASGSSNVMSKKVKARKLLVVDHGEDAEGDGSERKRQLIHDSRKPPIVNVYSRRSKRPRHSVSSVSFYDSLLAGAESTSGGAENGHGDGSEVGRLLKKKKSGGKLGELVKLGVDSDVLSGLDRPRLRDCRNYNFGGSNRNGLKRKKRSSLENCEKALSNSPTTKRWVRLSFDGADPKSFIGLQCKVYWPLDADWYSGRVVEYNAETNQHHVKYKDGDEEKLILSNERIKFYISREEMESLNLSCSLNNVDSDVYDYNEMVVLAASLDDCQEVEPGDIIWAKLTGHAMWPAIVVDESLTVDRKGLSKTAGSRSVPVQFFGTHDFARIRVKQVISFLRGLLSSFHLKCKKARFIRGLEEAKMYLSEQKLPKRMLRLQNGINVDEDEDVSGDDNGYTDSGEDCVEDLGTQKMLEGLRTSPYVIGDLQVISLGKIVKDSEYFQDNCSIWPEGYTALRKFTSIADPSACAVYKMEVLRDAESQTRPLFRVTLETGEQISGG